MSVNNFPSFSKKIIQHALVKPAYQCSYRLLGLDWGSKHIGLSLCKLWSPYASHTDQAKEPSTGNKRQEFFTHQHYDHFHCAIWPYKVLPVHLQDYTDPELLSSEYMKVTRNISRLLQKKKIDGMVSFASIYQY